MPSITSILLVTIIITLVATTLLNELYDEMKKLERINEIRQENQDYNEALDAFENNYKSNAGDPTYISKDVNISIPTLFPEQYESWDTEGNPNQDKLFYFDFDCNGSNEMGDRNPTGTLTLMRDYYPNNGKLDCGYEIFWSLDKTAYELMQPYDTNNNCHIDEGDSYWGQFLITDFDMTWTPEELGYKSFKICDPIIFPDDPFGVGIYSDGYTGYVPDEAFHKAIDAGWVPPQKLTDSHFRLKGMQECGVTFQDGSECERTFSGVLGYWEETKR
jgi:type II secretory pathway pseudopilin PulG